MNLQAKTIAAMLLVGLGTAGACSLNAPRDIVPESHDIHETSTQNDSGAAVPRDGYVYVATRAHAVVGVVGARQITVPEASRIADLIANELESCAVSKERDGTLAVGAASLVLVATARGTVVSDLRLSPGGPVAANALECLVAPVRTIQLPSTDAGITALALDATWNPAVVDHKAPP
ncbi:MAG: hypothetical protein FWD69_06390 [Polyangiaceae bacterium]|nr:hypothetical protein [Polyangiaceae bacterium]